MRLSFSYTLLITWILISISCKTTQVPINYSTQNISVSEDINPLDSQLVQVYLPFKKILEKDMGRVISISENEMTKNKPESELTNFLADLLLEYGNKEAKQFEFVDKVDVSYFNYGGIRTSLPEGEITVGKIFELMPFENELVFVQFNGKQLQEFFDNVAEKGGDSVGGARFIISNKKAMHVKLGNTTLNADGKYWLATNDYIANGGDGMEIFNQSLAMQNTSKKIRDIIIANLEEKHKRGELLNAELDGRISNE